jgi:hypothetical protein
MLCGKKSSLYYRLNLDIGVDHLALIVKFLRAFYGYLGLEHLGETCLQNMGLGIRATIGLVVGPLKEYGKPSGKCLKMMWTMRIFL